MKKILILICAVLIIVSAGFAQEQTILLPAPQMEIGKPLMQVLQQRKSSRDFITTPLSQQQLSNLLWAAFGINRAESGKRTAPSARNWQEMDIYVTNADGAFLYEAKNHSLKKILNEDIRGLTGVQPFVKDAAVNLVFVADYSKLGDAQQEDKLLYSGADAGFIAQNVYLYCASEGLGVVVRAMMNREELAKSLNLKPEQKIILAQTVGYTK